MCPHLLRNAAIKTKVKNKEHKASSRWPTEKAFDDGRWTNPDKSLLADVSRLFIQHILELDVEVAAF